MTPEHLDLLVSLLCSVLGIATLGLAFVYHIVDVKLLKTPPLGRLFLLRYLNRSSAPEAFNDQSSELARGAGGDGPTRP